MVLHLNATGRDVDALVLLDELIRRVPDAADLQLVRARTLCYLGRPLEGAAALQSSVRRDPALVPEAWDLVLRLVYSRRISDAVILRQSLVPGGDSAVRWTRRAVRVPGAVLATALLGLLPFVGVLAALPAVVAWILTWELVLVATDWRFRRAEPIDREVMRAVVVSRYRVRTQLARRTAWGFVAVGIAIVGMAGLLVATQPLVPVAVWMTGLLGVVLVALGLLVLRRAARVGLGRPRPPVPPESEKSATVLGPAEPTAPESRMIDLGQRAQALLAGRHWIDLVELLECHPEFEAALEPDALARAFMVTGYIAAAREDWANAASRLGRAHLLRPEDLSLADAASQAGRRLRRVQRRNWLLRGSKPSAMPPGVAEALTLAPRWYALSRWAPAAVLLVGATVVVAVLPRGPNAGAAFAPAVFLAATVLLARLVRRLTSQGTGG